MAQEARPDRHRRPDAGRLRARGRERRTPRAVASSPSTATYRRAVIDVPLADAGLPVLDRDRRASRRARDPAPRLVPPRRAAAGRVRLVVRGGAGRRHRALDPGHDLQDERATTSRRDATTVFEALDDAGLTHGRGEHHLLPRAAPRTAPTRARRHAARLRAERFFFYNLFESDVTGAPLAVRTRARGRSTPTRRGRPLARDARRLRLPRLLSPGLRLRLARARARGGARGARRTRDRAVGALSRRPAGPDEFLERYDVLLCSDHGQTRVERAVGSGRVPRTAALPTGGTGTPTLAVTASNRAGDGLPAARVPRERAELAARLDGDRRRRRRSSARTDEAVARRDGEEVRFAPAEGGWRRAATPSSRPPGRARARLGRARRTRTPATCSSPPRRARVRGPRRAPPRRRGQPRLARAGDSEVPMLAVGAGAAAGEDHRGRAARARAARRRLRMPPLTTRRAEDGRASSCAAADIVDERVLAAMERVPRELFVPEESATAPTRTRRCRSAAGQTISQPYMVARIARCSACGRRAGARRRHGLRLPGGRARRAGATRCTRSSGSPSSPSRRARTSPQPATSASHVHVGDGTLGLPGEAPFDAIAVAAAAPEAARAALRAARAAADGSASRSAAGAASASRSSSAARKGRPSIRSVPCRFVPLVGEQGFAD